jgi:hypothetical protein
LLLLPDLAEYRTGIIIVGLARCIAMVLIWNDLALGNREAAAVLVALNAVFQVAFYSVLGYFYLQVLPGWLGLDTSTFQVSIWEIARIVLVFLGVPLVAGYLTRRLGERARGREWYEAVFLPRLAPAAMVGLLFTVAVLFALQGEKITSQPLDVARIALPLLAYFLSMWVAGSPWPAPEAALRPHRHPHHRGQQRLRTRHRRRHRGVRHHLGRGPCRCGRAPRRGPGAGGAGLPGACRTAPLLPEAGQHHRREGLSKGFPPAASTPRRPQAALGVSQPIRDRGMRRTHRSAAMR